MLRNWGEEGKICYKLSKPKGLRCTYCSSNLPVCNYYFILRPLVFIASSNLVLGPYRSPIKSCLLPLERHIGEMIIKRWLNYEEALISYTADGHCIRVIGAAVSGLGNPEEKQDRL